MASAWQCTKSESGGTRLQGCFGGRRLTTRFRRWRQSHRFRLINLMNSQEAILRVIRETRLDGTGREYQTDIEYPLAQLNQRYSNVRATGGPVQCAPEVCEHLSKTMHFAPKASLEEMADNRFVMDVDGNA